MTLQVPIFGLPSYFMIPLDSSITCSAFINEDNYDKYYSNFFISIFMEF